MKKTLKILGAVLLIVLVARESTDESCGSSSFATAGTPVFCESSCGEEDLTEELAFLSTTHRPSPLRQLPRDRGLPAVAPPRSGRPQLYLLKHAFLT